MAQSPDLCAWAVGPMSPTCSMKNDKTEFVSIVTDIGKDRLRAILLGWVDFFGGVFECYFLTNWVSQQNRRLDTLNLR